ncbi:TetR/AcrR family transcriptional regulator [Microlunatus sp. Y2014]|uniref:TetR/AcrR family transcriptional regulator n=1 Tax=Microlunatus sp. Y2014 TaxID=3418488 RepID=UPI003DA6CF7A
MTDATSTRPSTRRPRRAQVRADVLDAAREAFLTHGYATCSVNDIAAEAGFTKGAVYSNFGGKPGLFAEVFQRDFGRATAQLVADLLDGTGLRDRAQLPDVAAGRLADLVIRQAPLQVAVGEFCSLAHSSPEVAETYAAMRADQLDLVADALHRQRLLGDGQDLADHREAAVLLLAVLSSLSLEHRAAPELYPRAVLIAALTRFLAGLLP